MGRNDNAMRVPGPLAHQAGAFDRNEKRIRISHPASKVFSP
jgi:hypothetical protein